MHEVTLELPVDNRFVSTLRLVAASLGAWCDLTVDNIEDLRLAVDEAAALLLPHAAPGSGLRTTFRIRPHVLEAALAVAAADDPDPVRHIDRNGFGWTLLAALTERIEVETSGRTLGIRLDVRRADGA